MSHDAISRPALEAISKGGSQGRNLVKTGKGGLSSAHQEVVEISFKLARRIVAFAMPAANLDEAKLAAVAANEQVCMFEITLSQGAKSGKAGILLRANVTGEIAHIRAIAEVENRSLQIETPLFIVQGISRAIARERRVTGKPVGYKAVIDVYGWLDELCLLIKQRGSKRAGLHYHR